MTEVFIKYNPYKIETQVKINGKPVKENSALNVEDKRFQEWVEDLPQILVDECNVKTFKITFNGTILDYEDLLSVTKEAKEKGINIECNHIPAKEVNEKEKIIKQIFNEIQQGPFEELKQADVKHAFENACSKEFEVNVVATMSAGKSTLINALLRKRIMPAKQEACTATITKIKDKDLEYFRATAYDKKGELIETHPELNYNIMDNLNMNPEVSSINVEGDIPFVSSEDISLVLVDTPGPNNSRDPEHKLATYRMLSETSKTVVLYILNATQLAVNDDNNLLNHVANSMKVGGKQSKDRFIFVVNKLDEFKKDEDSVVNSIEKVRKYLEDKGIKNANIYPASALTALNIRTFLKDINLSQIDIMDDDIDSNILESVMKMRKLNRNEELHLETYAQLTPSIRDQINCELVKAKDNKDMCTEALIHTGIISIESAIRMYVNKYAKTAKIKNTVDTFAKKLESAKILENIKQEISLNKDKHNEIKLQIDAIKGKLESGEEVKKFKEKIKNINYDKEIGVLADNSIKEAQARITNECSTFNSKLDIKEAVEKCNELNKFSQELQTDLHLKLDDIITNHVKKNAEELLNQYKQKISNLTQDVNFSDIKIDSFKLLNGEIESKIDINSLIEKLKTNEVINVGVEYVKNPEREGWGIFKFWKPMYIYRDVYEDKEFVDGSKLAQKYFAPIQKELFDYRDFAIEYASKQTENIKVDFNKKFIELDEVLKKKLLELQNCISNNENIERTIEESNEHLKWLENIQLRIDSILEI